MDEFIPSLEHLISKYFERHAGRSFSKRELVRALNISAAQRAELRSLLRELESRGTIIRLRGNRWCTPDSSHQVIGTLRVHPHRFGFVSPDDGTGDDIYIPEEGLSVALDGDRVLVDIGRRGTITSSRFGRASTTLRQGRITKILQRRRTRLTGQLCKTQWYWYVIPDSPRIIHTIRVRTDQQTRLHESHKVWVQLDEWTCAGEPLRGTVIEDLGPCDQAGVDILSIMRDHGIEADFPEDVLAEVRTVASENHTLDSAEREDLRNKLTFTIDPAEAKDFDDAVSLERLSAGGFKLGVHIADVSHFVRSGTALDREAFLRGNSVYLVDRVIPMLPPELSSNLCSLQPGRDRLTHTVEIVFDEHGRVASSRTFPSMIRSMARLTYDQVQRFLNREHDSDIPEPVREALYHMRALATVLRQRRMAQGALDLWMPEIRCVLDETGTPVTLLRRGADEAYNLIEEFMLVANRVVAERLASAEIPALYRIHPPPDNRQWEWMQQELKALDIPVSSRTRDALNLIARQYAQSELAHIVHLAILRNLKRACYSSQLAEHFGLAFTHYTHFTSPIRRYPDLVVHRLLKSIETKTPAPISHSDAARIAEHCSWTERNADDAEEESLDIKRLEYFSRLWSQGEIGPFEGVVVNVTPRGPIVELTDTLLRGLLPFRLLGNDYYLVNDHRTEARGQRTRKMWKIGQRVRVLLARVDYARRHVDFAPAESAAVRFRSSKKSRRAGRASEGQA